MTENGHGMQVVEVKDHSYQLNEELLEQLLMKEEVKDLPVVVVSVAGAYRGGKSFLLNFFLRYLSSPPSAREDGSWMDEDSGPLAGFHWRAGMNRNTTGILLWSEPFINVLPNGDKVVVLLMDTQGTFDSQSTVRDNSTIFALSTLISSVQIYNLSMNIQEDHLQHLQLFTMYGKMVQEQEEHVGKPFQILEFLVRDWQYPDDCEFGEQGGAVLLQERLEIAPNQPQELKDLRLHLKSCFEQLLCFLLPHPGSKVTRRSFKGDMKDIDPEFKIHIKDLVSSLLSPGKLCPKTVNGQTIKAGELFTYFKAYMTLFNSDDIPSPRSFMQATVEAGLLNCLNAARVTYEVGMEADCGPKQPPVPAGDVTDLHEKYLAAARAAFTSKRTMAAQEDVNKYLNQLSTELANRLLQYEQINLSKLQVLMKKASDVYDQTISAVTKGESLCLHPLDLDELQLEAVQAALKIYDGSAKKFSERPDGKRVELADSFAANLLKMKTTNDKNNRDAVQAIHSEYWRVMGSMSVTPPLPDAQFLRGHRAASEQALSTFKSKRNRASSYSTDTYEEHLTKIINDTFLNLHTINLRNIEKENARTAQEKLRIENERIQAEKQRDRLEQERRIKDAELYKTMDERNEAQREKDHAEYEKRILQNELEEERRKTKCVIL